MKAVRKQFYITPENEQKLERMARRLNWTQAAIIRLALDELPENASSTEEAFAIMRERVDARLRALGYRVPDPAGEKAWAAERDAHERELDAVMAPFGDVRVATAVWEDREGVDA